MEVSTSLSSLISPSVSNLNQNPASNSDQLVLSTLIDSPSDGNDAASVSLDFGSIYKSLAIGTKQLIDKLNELLGSAVPNGIQSLKPEDVTPDATATHIVQGITGLYGAFAKQNSNLSAEEVLTKFMEQARKGVDQGYSDAYSTLDGLGAFDYDGVKDGIADTKSLIEEKLKAFEAQKRKDLGLDPSDIPASAAAQTKTGLLAQAGGSTLQLAA